MIFPFTQLDSVTKFLIRYLFVFAGLFRDEESRNQWLNTSKASLVAALPFEGGIKFSMLLNFTVFRLKQLSPSDMKLSDCSWFFARGLMGKSPRKPKKE